MGNCIIIITSYITSYRGKGGTFEISSASPRRKKSAWSSRSEKHRLCDVVVPGLSTYAIPS